MKGDIIVDALAFLGTVREICELHESCVGCPLNGDEKKKCEDCRRVFWREEEKE